LFFLHASKCCHLLLVHTFALMKNTLMMRVRHEATFVIRVRRFILNCYNRLSGLTYHGRTTTPIVIFTTSPVSANNSEWTIFPVYFAPVMVYTFFITCAYFTYWRSFVPIMVRAYRPILAHNFLVDTILHFLHILYVFSLRLSHSKRIRSYTMCKSF